MDDIDTSAFANYKNRTSQSTPPGTPAKNPVTNVDISAFGMQWSQNALASPAPTRPNIREVANQLGNNDGLVSTLLRQTPAGLKQALSNEMTREREIRKDMTFAQDTKRTFIDKPAEIIKFLAQGVGGGVLGLGRSIQETAVRPFVGRERAQEIVKPKGDSFGINWDKVISGEERVQSYSEMRDSIDKFAEESGVATEWEKNNLGISLVGAIFILDALPIPGSRPIKRSLKETIETLVEVSTRKGVIKQLGEAGLDPKIAGRMADDIAAATTKGEVEDVLRRELGDSINDIITNGGTRQASQVPVDSAGRQIDQSNPAVARVSRTTPEEVPAGRTPAGREAPEITRAPRTPEQLEFNRAQVARIIDEATEPDAFTRALRTVDVDNIDDRIRIFADEDPTAARILDRLRADIEFEKKSFDFDNPDVKLDTPEGEQAFNNFFQEKFGLTPDVVDNIQYVNRVMNARRSVGQAAARMDEAVNQTPVTVGDKSVITNTDVSPIVKVSDDTIDTGAIRDLARRDQSTLNPTRAVGSPVVKGRNLAKEIEGNIAKYNQKLPDKDIVAAREANLLGPESIEEIIARKRGIITDAESIERAKRIKGTLQDVIDLPKGTTATKEQLQAIEQMVQNERGINKAISVLIDNGGMAATAAERNLIKKLGQGFEQMTDHEVLNHALAESTINLKRAEIVMLGIRSETGRTLQSMNKIVDGVDNRLRVLFGKINSNKKFDAMEKQAMIEMISKLDTNDNKAFLKALDKIAPSDMFDKVAEWSVAAKLWNPTTHMVNFGGNSLRMLSDIAVKGVTNPMALKADMAGAKAGFNQGMKNSLRALTDEGYAAQLSKYVETGGTAPAIGGRLGKLVRTPFRALGASDEVFKNVAYQRKLYRDAYNITKKEGVKGDQFNARMEELLNTPTFKMMEDATNEAKRMTFQEDLGEVMTKINTLRNPEAFTNKFGKGAAVGIRFFLPFLKTPTNLFKQAVDMSPVGVIKNWDALKKAAKSGDREKVGTILGEAILGSAIAVYIANETLDGNITGGAPRDSSSKDRFYRENKIPYAIKIGETWYQYKRVDPFASIVGLTADLTTLGLDGEANVGSVFGSVAENLKDKTYLSGVSDLMKVLTGDDWERDYALKSMVLGAAMPSFVGHTTRSLDPTIRAADTLGQRLLVQVPGMSESFPARVNVLGYDIERANKGLNYFFNPIQTATAEIDPVTEELMEINKSIAVPADNFSRNKVKYQFTETEYQDYGRYVGTRLRFELIDMFNSPKYERSNVDDKIKMVDKLRRDIQDDYKDAWVEEKTSAVSGSSSNISRAQAILQGRDPNAEGPASGVQGADGIREYFLGS